MSEYKGIKGFQVQTRTEDPSPTEVQIGDFYYNSTTGQFKTVNDGGAPIGTWASGGALNTARYSATGVGTQTAAMVSAGQTNTPGPSFTAANEQYDGSSWTEVNNLSNARNQLGGAGASGISAVAFGGGTDTYTEEWTADNALADVTVS